MDWSSGMELVLLLLASSKSRIVEQKKFNSRRVEQYAVKVRRHTPWSRVRCHECWFTHRQFHSQFHSRRHSLRITLKYTTLVRVRSGYAWTMIPWQRSEDAWSSTAYSTVTPSRKAVPLSHVRGLSPNGDGRGYFVIVTGSTWQIMGCTWLLWGVRANLFQ